MIADNLLWGLPDVPTSDPQEEKRITRNRKAVGEGQSSPVISGQ